MSRLSALNALPPSAFLAKLWPSHPHTSTPSNLLKPPLLTENPDATDINTNTHADKEPSPSSLHLHLHTPTSLSPLQFTRCFDLVRSTSAADYKASSRGWRPGEKRREMRLREMRYLLLVGGECGEDEEGKEDGDWEGEVGKEDVGGGGEGEGEGEGRAVYGFCSFMLTLEDGVEVLYCYEIHLDERVRGKGIGKWMMGVLEEVGRRAEVEKAMLTVFRRNEVAVRFYEGLGYGVDEFSPGPKKLRNGVVKEVDYLIMSKSLSCGGGGGEGAQRSRRAADETESWMKKYDGMWV